VLATQVKHLLRLLHAPRYATANCPPSCRPPDHWSEHYPQSSNSIPLSLFSPAHKKN
jgi:hypothetical protein